MVAQAVTPIKGRVMRVVTLDACGNPVTGASSSQVISGGFISVKMTPQYEDGVEFLQRAADGTFCVNDKDPGQLKRVQLDVTMCTMDPDMITIVSGGRLLTSGGATGLGNAWGETQVTNRFSLEIWQNVAGKGACSAGGAQQYIYWALPNTGNVQISDYTIENGMGQLKFSAETKSAGYQWGDGPGTLGIWLPSGATLQTTEHWAWNVTTTAPPSPTYGAVLLS